MIGKIYHYFKLTFTFLVSYYKLYRKKYKKGTFCYQEYKDNKKCKETLFCTFEHLLGITKWRNPYMQFYDSLYSFLKCQL